MESYSGNDHSGSGLGSTFQNPVYDDASCVNETGESKSKDGFIHRRSYDMEKARSDEATERKIITAAHFRTPLFKEMLKK